MVNLSGVLRSMAVGKLSVSGHIQSDAVRFGPCLRVVITPLSSRRRHVVVPSAPLNGSVADPSLRASADAKNHTRACSSGIWCLWSWAENLLESSNMSRLYCLQFEIEGPTKVSKVQELQQGMHLFCTKTRKHTGRFMPYHCYKTSAAQRQLQGL